MRTIVGLAIVIGVIYGLYWVLKQVKTSREASAAGSGLETLATLPLGQQPVAAPGARRRRDRPGRRRRARRHADPHLQRARGPRARPARRPPTTPVTADATLAGREPSTSPRASSSRCAEDGDQVKTDGSNAVQLLLLIGGISLVPALLFTVTGFTRILIVLGFIRSGLGTPTAPPNQVLVGIALFLTLFVMSPTFKKIKDDAIDPLQKRQDHPGAGASSAPRSRCASSCSTRRAPRTSRCSPSSAKSSTPKTRADIPTYVLIPAFIISELKTAFQIGFLIFLPFLIIDLVVGVDVDVDGHDDAATRLHLPAVQDPAVRPRGRLEPRHPLARAELPRMTRTGRQHRACRRWAGLKIALPMLLVGLVVGLLVSIFQAVTQIQEQTLSFIPKILGLVVVVVDRRPVDARPARQLDRRSSVRLDPDAGRADEPRRAARAASASSRSPASSSSSRASRRCSSSRRCSRRR